MLDSKIKNKSILTNTIFKVNVFKPINRLSLDFLEDFSKLLRKNNKKNLSQDLLYLVFWCARKKKELEKNESSKFRVGRGLAFHICPSNVPTNFIYSFFFGLLSGNSNIVKLPSKDFKEFIYNSKEFNPHIMFIAKPNIMNNWFTDLFYWLDECEKVFGFENLKGYETTRLYAYLAERYLSFWFKKYSEYLEWSYVFLDTEKNK